MHQGSAILPQGQRLAVFVLAVLGAACLLAVFSVESHGAASASVGKAGHASATTSAARKSQSCSAKRKRASNARKRSCRGKRSSKANDGSTAPAPGNKSEGPQASTPEKEVTGPKGPVGPEPSCDDLPGDDCSIYSDKFWELLAKYSRFEPNWASEPGVYPEPPDCMEAQETGPVMCPQMVTFLYPDGTLGGESWVIDECAPKGWRFYGEDPATC